MECREREGMRQISERCEGKCEEGEGRGHISERFERTGRKGGRERGSGRRNRSVKKERKVKAVHFQWMSWLSSDSHSTW